MKKLALIFLILTINIFSQITNPKHHKFYIYPDTNSTSKDSVLISDTLNRFRSTNNFRFNWHWSTTKVTS